MRTSTAGVKQTVSYWQTRYVRDGAVCPISQTQTQLVTEPGNKLRQTRNDAAAEPLISINATLWHGCDVQ